MAMSLSHMFKRNPDFLSLSISEFRTGQFPTFQNRTKFKYVNYNRVWGRGGW